MKGRWIVYTPKQLEFIQANCTMIRRELTDAVNAKFGTDYSNDNIKSLCTRKGWNTGRDGRFKKGGTYNPNSGTKIPNKTSFKRGHKPANHKPVGYERTNVEGYIEIKTAEGMRKFRLKQRIVWEQHHGKLKPGEIIRFKDGNRQNCSIENLELFTRAENAFLNKLKVNDYPEQIRPAAKAIARVMARTSELERN